jgi:hypothetical protein
MKIKKIRQTERHNSNSTKKTQIKKQSYMPEPGPLDDATPAMCESVSLTINGVTATKTTTKNIYNINK